MGRVQVNISINDIQAIVEGRHGAPYDVLGLHVPEDGKGLSIRAFQPHAESVEVVDTASGIAHAMRRVHDDGFFEWSAPNEGRFPYRLRMTEPGGHRWELEDPYRLPLRITDFDLHLHGEGTHYRTYEKMGAHVEEREGVRGVHFAVWAPNAERVSVIGDFNRWDGRHHPMQRRGDSGLWELFLPALCPGDRYKYEILGPGGFLAQKADPYAFASEIRPNTASKVWDLKGYAWGDGEWMESRAERDPLHRPVSVYEVHPGSWRRRPEEGDRWLSYREMADELIPYVKEMGYTHLELLPVTEHPFDGSWGYQTIGYYAPTSRFGSPDDFKYFIDRAHRENLGVILDWVPAHFPRDATGLAFFDGTHLYEHSDPRQGEHRDWGTLIFNYGRNEVRSFLLSNAMYWAEVFHIDGLRVDAVASMLYLDYSREQGDWVPNVYGGRENLEAISFLKKFNEIIHGAYPGILTFAEESTSWPMVSRPVHLGGLGFGLKWNMGWMNDTLGYFSRDPVHRKYHHHNLTFSLIYAFSENFILPLSHDEVVHGKGSLIGKMPGDDWQKFANLRLLYALMYAHPGRKLLFMGCEFGQWREWNFNASLDWHLLEREPHWKLRELVRDLNGLYSGAPALHELDFDSDGFEWIEGGDAEQGVAAFLRKGRNPGGEMVCVFNSTPVARRGYRVGVPREGRYQELLNTDSDLYGGSNTGNAGGVTAEDEPAQGRPRSLLLTLPPLGAVFLQHDNT